jgi:metal-responsive CopG/Arc/MetJ family transcriptional regulator
MMDEELLRAIDAEEEVRKDGRSAFFRKVAKDYLNRRRRLQIVKEYRAAYGSGSGLGKEFDGWEEEGVWPEG